MEAVIVEVADKAGRKRVCVGEVIDDGDRYWIRGAGIGYGDMCGIGTKRGDGIGEHVTVQVTVCEDGGVDGRSEELEGGVEKEADS